MGKSELLKSIVKKEKFRIGSDSDILKRMRESYSLADMVKGFAGKAWQGLLGAMRKLRGKK